MPLSVIHSDLNLKETPWNVKTTNYHTKFATKRPVEYSSFAKDIQKDDLPPCVKRRHKGNCEGGIRPTYGERGQAKPPRTTKGVYCMRCNSFCN